VLPSPHATQLTDSANSSIARNIYFPTTFLVFSLIKPAGGILVTGYMAHNPTSTWALEKEVGK